MSDLATIYSQLALAARRAYDRGIQTGNGGNLSARVPGAAQMVVKSSGGSFADCDADGSGFILTDFEGQKVENVEGRPTREAFLHGLIYQLSPQTGGVMHCHSVYAITWSFTQRALPMVTQHLKLKFKCEIPVLDIDSPMVLPEHGPLVGAELAQNPDLPAFILRGHGVVALGKDVLTAEHNAELVEETAQIAVLSALCRNAGLYDRADG